jgi:predicted nucleic acid-binding protein
LVRTFLDTGVLIAAARAGGRDQERALHLLEEDDRMFLTSPFIYLEVVPKTIFFKRRLERSFYEKFFHNAIWCRELDKIEAAARAEAASSGLGAMDALHVAAAHLMDAHELITTEKPARSIHRSSLVKVIYLFR